jgi:hypothetical protein
MALGFNIYRRNMSRNVLLKVFIITLLALSISACGRWMIKGRVVDTISEQPIEKAAVYIYWSKMGKGPPGLAGYVDVEKAEDLTDSEGFFKVPKYSTWFKDYRMAVYKKGYVCWSSEKIFPTWEERKDFRLKNGMVNKLERFKEEYSKEAHADFTLTWSLGSRGLFDDAVKSERELRRELIRKRKKRKRQ